MVQNVAIPNVSIVARTDVTERIGHDAGGAVHFKTVQFSLQSLQNFPGAKRVEKVSYVVVSRHRVRMLEVMRNQNQTAIVGR